MIAVWAMSASAFTTKPTFSPSSHVLSAKAASSKEEDMELTRKVIQSFQDGGVMEDPAPVMEKEPKSAPEAVAVATEEPPKAPKKSKKKKAE